MDACDFIYPFRHDIVSYYANKIVRIDEQDHGRDQIWYGFSGCFAGGPYSDHSLRYLMAVQCGTVMADGCGDTKIFTGFKAADHEKDQLSADGLFP